MFDVDNVNLSFMLKYNVEKYIRYILMFWSNGIVMFYL